MERRNLLVGLGLIFIASTLATQVDPRGARPVPQGTRGDKCATDKEWPFCTDDEWGSKCPSGCRIQGLLDQYDHQLLKRIGNIRKLLDQYRAKHRSADQVSKQTYDYLKEKLIIDSGNDNSYYDLAQSLRQRITDMKIKIDRQLRVLAALKDRVKDQVVEMQRMEVDIDIKLRSCKGSCKSYTEYQVDRESYVDLEKQIKQLDSQSAQDIESVGTLYVMKSRQLQDVVVDSIYKSKDIISGAAAQQKVDLFPEVKTVQLILEEEGSSSSPATISKVPGTSYSPSTSSSSSSLPSSSSAFSSSFSSSSHSSTQPFSSSSHSSTLPFSSSSHSSTQPFSSSSHTTYSSTQPFPSSSHSSTSFSSSSHSSTQPFSSSSHSSTLPFSSSSHSSTPSKSITELGGRGDGDFFGTGGAHSSTGHVSTKSVSCTKSIRRTIVHTKDGPVERTEEVMDGGPGCQGVTDLTKGGMGAFFPSLGHTSSSSSSMTTKTVHAGGAKGSLLTDSRQGFGFGSDIGLDLGAFMQSHADDDIPDFHARSVKSIRVERQADYIGKVCKRLRQQSQDGRQSLSTTKKYRKRHCRAKSGFPLCSDDDWVSNCPSGCRLQGLILQMESEVEKKLRKVCKTAKTYEDAAEKSMMATTKIYNSNRRVLVNRYMSELKFVEHAEGLARNLTLLRKRSAGLSQQLKKLHGDVQEQIKELYRSEVDIDMKLRACRGSCQSALPFSVDHPSYQTLQTHMDQMDKTVKQKRKSATPPEDIPHIKLQPVDIGTATYAEYKTIPTVQRELLTQFEDLGQNQVVLEELLEESSDFEFLDLSELE